MKRLAWKLLLWLTTGWTEEDPVEERLRDLPRFVTDEE